MIRYSLILNGLLLGAISSVGRAGITDSCARCHDHKFDPIPQQDYYSLAGIFNNSSMHDLPLASADAVQKFSAHKKQVEELNRKINSLTKSKKKKKEKEKESLELTAEEQA